MENYKEKYEHAIGRIKTFYQSWEGTEVNTELVLQELKEIFPELRENEDEKIKNEIIDYIKGFISHHRDDLVAKSKVWITWLEKQGKVVEEYEDKLDRCACESFDKGYKAALEKQNEQNTVDKVEPKFHKGDWIIIDNPCQIIDINENHIVQYCDDENAREISKKFCESHFHLWTIEDVKDGDILQLGFVTAIFKKFVNFQPSKHYCCCYCSYCHDEFEVPANEDFYGCIDAKPATKEQCDLLFQKMKEAGYEWNVEKKELKKI